jgi:hypothetical protein
VPEGVWRRTVTARRRQRRLGGSRSSATVRRVQGRWRRSCGCAWLGSRCTARREPWVMAELDLNGTVPGKTPKLELGCVRYETRWARAAEVLVCEAACKGNWTEVVLPCHKRIAQVRRPWWQRREGGQLSGHLGLAAWADAVGAARALESRQDVHVR